MPYENEHAARVMDPGKFEDDSFRRKNIEKGIDIIIGKLKGEDKMTTQAYRFKADKWTTDEAKAWLKEHDIKYISFEAASGKSLSGFRTKSNYELKDVDEKKGIVTGYASIFGNVDSDSDMVMPGAYSKTLSERGVGSAKPRIKHLWQHDSWSPIAVPQKLEEHDRGLYFESVFGKDQFSQDKLQQHIDGIITEMSIGYNIIKSEDIKDEPLHHKLLELKLWEYSSVTWGSNSLTEIISAKGEVKDVLSNLNKRIEALNKGLKNGKYTDETAEQFEAELNKINSIIQSLKIAEPEVVSTQEVIEPINSKQILETILKTLKDGSG
jgi:uncharacterized protein